MALWLLFAAAHAGARRPLAELLPASTVLAVELNSEDFDLTALSGLLAGLDSQAATTAAAPLKALAASAHQLARSQVPRGVRAPSVPAECAPLVETLKANRGGPWSAAVGLSLSSATEPQGLLLLQPSTRTLAAQLLAGTVACLDGRRYADQDGTAIYNVKVEGEKVYFAVLGNVMAVSNSTHLLRGALRRAAGSAKGSLATTPIGSRAASAGAGIALTFNPVPLQANLRALTAIVPPERRVLIHRLVTTLRSIDGYRLAASLTADGLSVTSTVGIDEEVIRSNRENALLDLLTCAGCNLSGAPALPHGAVARSGTAVPLTNVVEWVDSWLADLAQAGLIDPGAASVRGAAWRYAGIDLGALLLDWFGGNVYTTVTGVLDTDIRNWVQGVPVLTSVPVTSEEAAWKAINDWVALAQQAEASAAASRASAPARHGPARRGRHGGLSAGPADDLRLADLLAVEELEHAGVPFLRLRVGPTTDVGVAVFDGQLVMGSPTAALLAAIDQRSSAGTDAGALGAAIDGLTGNPTGTLTAYSVIDVGSFVRGVANVAELGSGSVATALAAGVRSARSGEFGPRVANRARSLPEFTFADALAITDTAVNALRVLADNVGFMTSSTIVQDGARVTTWRLPFLR